MHSWHLYEGERIDAHIFRDVQEILSGKDNIPPRHIISEELGEEGGMGQQLSSDTVLLSFTSEDNSA